MATEEEPDKIGLPVRVAGIAFAAFLVWKLGDDALIIAAIIVLASLGAC